VPRSIARAAALLVALCACGSAAPVAPPRPPAPPPAPPPAASIVPAAFTAPEPAPAAPAPADPPPPAVVFPPPAFAPPYARTAKPGDGTWSPLFEGAPGAAPLGVRATVHPEPIKPQPYVAIVAVDLRRVALHLVAGTLEPASPVVPPTHRTGLVPPEAQPDLLAVFNGGFMERHGHWGMRLGADVFVPPRPEGCTIALEPSGAVRVRPWPDLAATEASATAWRQTPPCLVTGGELDPRLVAEPKTRVWGAAIGGALDIRRSALGVDATGRVLFYGLGEWTLARDLATAMKAAGAVDVAELDINWGYTRFLMFGRRAEGAPLEVTATLVPKTKHTATGYVAKPAERDFFYLARKR
jgi:hypothetical protein